MRKSVSRYSKPTALLIKGWDGNFICTYAAFRSFLYLAVCFLSIFLLFLSSIILLRLELVPKIFDIPSLSLHLVL